MRIFADFSFSNSRIVCNSKKNYIAFTSEKKPKERKKIPSLFFPSLKYFCSRKYLCGKNILNVLHKDYKKIQMIINRGSPPISINSIINFSLGHHGIIATAYKQPDYNSSHDTWNCSSNGSCDGSIACSFCIKSREDTIIISVGHVLLFIYPQSYWLFYQLVGWSEFSDSGQTLLAFRYGSQGLHWLVWVFQGNGFQFWDRWNCYSHGSCCGFDCGSCLCRSCWNGFFWTRSLHDLCRFTCLRRSHRCILSGWRLYDFQWRGSRQATHRTLIVVITIFGLCLGDRSREVASFYFLFFRSINLQLRIFLVILVRILHFSALGMGEEYISFFIRQNQSFLWGCLFTHWW